MPTYALDVNSRTQTVDVRDPAEPLLFVLRNQFNLTGAKYGCGLGQCGACTVLVDGAATRSCMLPVSQATGKKIVTVEGLSNPGKPHPVHAAFIEQQAAQCGYCIPGMTVSAAALLAKNANPSREQVKEALAGNLCRCGTHQRIVNAVMAAAGAKS